MRIALLAIPGSMRSALAGIADMFWLANQIIVQNPQVNADIARTSPFLRSWWSPPMVCQSWTFREKIVSDGSFNDAQPVDLVIASGMQLDEQKLPLAQEAVTAAAEWVKENIFRAVALQGPAPADLSWVKPGYSTDAPVPRPGGCIIPCDRDTHWRSPSGESHG
jgi:hypothetical protein